jgi:hypothetical protein
MSELRSQTVSIYSIYYPAYDEPGGLTKTQFAWAFGSLGINQPETYTISIADQLALEFDRHIPVRPISITVFDKSLDDAGIILASLFGIDTMTTIMQTKNSGGLIIANVTLGPEDRFAIASFQAKHPLTPRLLKAACRAMLDIHNRSLKQLPPVSPLPPSPSYKSDFNANTPTDIEPIVT